MVVLLVVEKGLIGESLVALMRGTEPRLRVVLAEAPRDEGCAFTPDVAPDLVVVEGSSLGMRTSRVLGALRHCHPAVPVLLLRSDDAVDDEGIIRLPRDAGSRVILERIQALLGGAGTGTAPEAPRHAPIPREVQVPVFEGLPSFANLGMTHEETRVLALAAQGRSNPEIALILKKAEGTVRAQIGSVLRKLKVRNRTEAISVANRIAEVVDTQIGFVEEHGLDVVGLLPHMKHRRMKAGATLFRKGDPSDALYFVQRGIVLLPEFGERLGERETLGEIGVFAPHRKRTCSAVCETDVELFEIDAKSVKQAYVLNPGFAMYLVNKITSRLVADQKRVA